MLLTLEKALKAIVESVDVEKPQKKRHGKKKRAKLRKGEKKSVEKVLPLRSESVKSENGAKASDSERSKKTDLVGGANNQEQQGKSEKGSKK